MTVLTIPSPSQGVWDLGPFPVRAYALCIILGVVAAIWIGERRWVARGGRSGQVSDLALWMVPFGLVGGRLYHVITDSQLYFGEGREPITALYVWRGGLGIWGAIALGAVGLYIGARRMGIKVPPVADAIAPGVLIGQALGRFGNWFNQELFGRPTDLPWGLEIDAAHRPPGYLDESTFHPTFLYEAIWCTVAFFVIVWIDRRYRMGHGRVVALYVMAYTLGRGWIEALRIDQVELDNVLGLRWNVWTSIILFVAAAVYFVVSLRRNPGRETNLYRDDRYDEPDEAEPGTDATDESNHKDEQDAADATSRDPSRDPSPDREPTDEAATTANGSDNGSPDGKVGA